MKANKLLLCSCLLLISWFRSCSPASPSDGSWFAQLKRVSGYENAEKWSSLLTVDPSNLVHLMIEHGGLVLPDSTRDDIVVLGKLCHVKEVGLNVVERKLELRNFCVRLPNEDKAALHVERLYVEWDSYLKPCLKIKVENVKISLEFYNLLLTKNNWLTLRELGFPPEFLFSVDDSETEQRETSSFLRISGIDLSGDMMASVRSQPLGKEIAVISFDLNAFDAMDKRIQDLSEKSLVSSGRPGCTLEEIYELVEKHVGGMIGTALANILNDLSSDGDVTKEMFGRAVNVTANVARTYVSDSQGWTKSKVQKLFAEKLGEIGIDLEKEENEMISKALDGLKHAAKSKIPEGSRLHKMMSSLQGMERALRKDERDS